MENSIDPPDAGKRDRHVRRKRSTLYWVGRVLRNRRTLLVVLWVAKIILKLIRVFYEQADGS